MVFVSRFGVSLPSSPSLFFSHSTPHNHYFHLCPTPPSATSSSLWCFARCVHTAGWRWMMPFATSSWTSPVFHPGWLGRMTSSKQLSTKLSPPKRSITRAKVLYYQKAGYRHIFFYPCYGFKTDSNILFKILYFIRYLVWRSVCVMAATGIFFCDQSNYFLG